MYNDQSMPMFKMYKECLHAQLLLDAYIYNKQSVASCTMRRVGLRLQCRDNDNMHNERSMPTYKMNRV